MENKITSKDNPLYKAGWRYYCIKCRYAIGVNVNCIDYTEEEKYCPNCGRKLNWEE